MAQLTCKNLTLGYDNRAIQEDLNFSIDAGDYLCIVGENGSGKSTLMKTLLGLQPPISGRILTGDGLRKNEIGYLPQQTVVQKDFPASVREIVLSGCQGRCGSRPFYNKEEKQLIARYAAALITKDDFVYLDAGTTTGCMIDFITEKSATYVTNAVSHAQKLAAAGFRVYLIGGELKPTTEAVVGNQAILSLETLHFSKAFFGTNGVSLKAGFSTPDYEEAMVKKTAIGQAKKAYILADYSKFGNISSVTFEEFAKAQVITDRKPPEAFLRSKNIIVA